MISYFDTVQGIPGYWSNRGKFYPAIMGGSDAMTSAAAMVSGNGNGEGGGESSGGSTDGSGDGGRSQESSGNSFSSEILNNLEWDSPSDRKAVEKYLKQIDGQVTQRFQSVHDQYKWAKDLDPSDVERAMGVAKMVENNPHEMFKIMAQAFTDAGMDPSELLELEEAYEDGDEYNEDGDYEDDDEYGDLPQGFIEKFEQQQELLESIAEIVLDQNRSQQEAVEDQELEDEIAELADNYGEFDEDIVLSYAAANETTLEEAVKYYKQLESRLTGGVKKPREQGPTLSSGGVSSSGNDINPAKLDQKQTKNLVAQLIAAQGE